MHDKDIDKLRNLETINGIAHSQINDQLDHFYGLYPEYQDKKLKEY